MDGSVGHSLSKIILLIVAGLQNISHEINNGTTCKEKDTKGVVINMSGETQQLWHMSREKDECTNNCR